MHGTSAGGITKPGGGNIGTGVGFCARASVDPARGTLTIPSTVAKAAFTSVLVSRRIGVSSVGLDPGNVLIFRRFDRHPDTQILIKVLG
jgi:hypothetical protein